MACAAWLPGAEKMGPPLMGREQKRVTVYATVSRHNEARDERDDALWELLLAEIRMLIEDDKYKPISPDIG